MNLNIHRQFAFIGAFTDFESWIFLGLLISCVVFSAIAITLIRLRKHGKSKNRTMLLIVCIVFLLFFIAFGFVAASGMLDDLGVEIFDSVATAYESRVLYILNVAVLVPLLFCCYILLFPPIAVKSGAGKEKTANKKYLSEFELETEDEEVETIGVKDVFKEFGSTESDVRGNVDRIAKKLTQSKKEDKTKSAIAEIGDALDEGKIRR